MSLPKPPLPQPLGQEGQQKNPPAAQVKKSPPINPKVALPAPLSKVPPTPNTSNVPLPASIPEDLGSNQTQPPKGQVEMVSPGPKKALPGLSPGAFKTRIRGPSMPVGLPESNSDASNQNKMGIPVMPLPAIPTPTSSSQLSGSSSSPNIPLPLPPANPSPRNPSPRLENQASGPKMLPVSVQLPAPISIPSPIGSSPSLNSSESLDTDTNWDASSESSTKDKTKKSKKKNGTKKSKSSKKENLDTAIGSSWETVYDEFETKVTSQEITQDPLYKDVLSFPAPDTAVETQQRNPGTLPSVSSKAPFYVQETMKLYSEPVKTVHHLSEQYGRYFGLRDKALASQFVSSNPAEPVDLLSELSPQAAATISLAQKERDKSAVGRGGSLVAPLGPLPKGSSSRMLLARSSSISANAKNAEGIPNQRPPSARSNSIIPNSPSNPDLAQIAANAKRTSPPANRVPSGSEKDSFVSPRMTSGSPAPPNIPLPVTPAFTSTTEFLPTSPTGTTNMLSSWLTTDANARAAERQRRLQKNAECPPTLFQALDGNLISTEPIDDDFPKVQPLAPHTPANQLLIRCKSINWTHASNQEIMCFSMSLHDVAQKIKLTEDFHFDFVEDIEPGVLSTLLPDVLGAISTESKTKRALIPLSYRSPSIYLLVRVKVVLKGDPEEGLEPYLSSSKLNPKDQQKWMDSTAKATKILGHYRQAIAWGAVPVFNDGNRLLLHDDTQIKLYRMKPILNDELFYDTITSAEKMKLLKPLEGTLSLSGYLYTPEKWQLQSVFDTNLIKYPSYDAATNVTSGSTQGRTVIAENVKEIKEFAQSFHQTYANAAFENNFYLYPISINSSTSKIKIKTVSLRIWLLKAEGEPEQEALKAVYGTSSSANLINHYNTTVELNEKSPLLFDEIKFQLPTRLTNKHHIVIQVYAVHPKILNPKKKSDLEPEKLLGQCFFPLFNDHKFLENGTYTRSISAPITGTYAGMVYLGEPPANLIDEDKFTITFSTRLVSSLYTTDDNLASFYNLSSRGNPADYLKSLESLAQVPDSVILSCFASLLNYLFSNLFADNGMSAEASEATLLAIIEIASKVSFLTLVSGKINVSEELLIYAQCHFEPKNVLKAYSVLTEGWVKLLTKHSADMKTYLTKGGSSSDRIARLATTSLTELGWWFLQLIVRSLILKTFDTREIDKDSNRKLRFAREFSQSLVSLFEIIHDLRRVSATGFDNLNKVIARFCRDLYRIVDRGFVSKLISLHLAELAKESKITSIFRFKFLQVVSDYEHYVPLNVPMIHPITVGTSKSSATSLDTEIRQSFWKRHFLAGHYINEFRTQLILGEDGKITRSKAIAKFRDLLWKHTLDTRYSTAAHYERLATIYFPLVMLAFDNVSLISGLKDDGTPIGTLRGHSHSVSSSSASNSPQISSNNAQPRNDSEWRDWCYVVMWILRYCNKQLHFLPWRNQEGSNPATRDESWLKFILFMKYCADTFGKSGPSALQDEIITAIADSLDYFMQDIESIISTEGNKVYEDLGQLFLLLLKIPKSSMATAAVLGALRFFISGLKKPLFRYASTNLLSNEICFELFRHCQQQHSQVMSAATSLLYMMIRTNYEEMGDIARTKLNSTLALSKLIKMGSDSTVSTDDLLKSLEAMEKHQEPNASSEFTDQVKQLFARHRRVVRDSVRVAQIAIEFADHKLEYYYKIAQEYLDTPELRIQWILDMGKLHEKIEYWDEAALCRIQIGLLVGQYFYQSTSANPNSLISHTCFANKHPTIVRVAPFLYSSESPLGNQLPSSYSSDFTEDNLITILTDAARLFEKNEQYEAAIDVYTLLCQFCLDSRKHAVIVPFSDSIKELASKSDKANRAQSRITPNFYRTGFYGKGFGEDNNKEFIYKVNPTFRLADFTEQMVNRYKASLGTVEILNNKPISEQNLDPNKNYLQIVNLEPYFEADYTKELSHWDRTFGIKRFFYETAYNPEGGRPSEDVSKMYKRKDIITAKMAFPNFFRRVEVASKESRILQPIDCAMDLMMMLTSKLKQALNCVPLVAKNLQIILQGAVLAQVNAGPAAILTTFLGNPQNYPAEQIEKLKEIFRSFIRACQFGLRLNEKLIETQPDTSALQEAMVKSFTNLQAEASKYLDD